MIVEKWKQSQAYVIGVDHINRNQVCQDRTFYKALNGVHVIALADGAGSKQKSELGAELVTKKICDILSHDFYKYYMMCEKSGKKEHEYQRSLHAFKHDMVDQLVKELKMVAITENRSIHDLASTLLFCAIHENKYIIGHIGDGVVGGLTVEGDVMSVKTLSEPHNGDSPNITFFLTDMDAYDNLRISVGELNELKGIILMSDGPAEVLYHKNTGLNDNILRIFENFKEINSEDYNQILHQFLSEKIASYSYDDLSLNLLYLERTQSDELTPYMENLFTDITSKEQLIPKSQYCVSIDPTKKTTRIDFSSFDEIKDYLKWT